MYHFDTLNRKERMLDKSCITQIIVQYCTLTAFLLIKLIMFQYIIMYLS